MKKYLLLVNVVLLVFFSGCKEKTVTKNLTKTDMVSRTWICDEAEIVSTPKTAIYKKGASGNLLELKDSFVTFFNDGRYEGIDFNATPQTGQWKFKNDETVAELDSWDYEFKIVDISAKNLNFNTQVEFNGKVYDIFVKMIPK